MRVGQVGGQVGEDRRRACPARGKLNEEVAAHADFRARIRPMEFQLTILSIHNGKPPIPNHSQCFLYTAPLVYHRISSFKTEQQSQHATDRHHPHLRITTVPPLRRDAAVTFSHCKNIRISAGIFCGEFFRICTFVSVNRRNSEAMWVRASLFR